MRPSSLAGLLAVALAAGAAPDAPAATSRARNFRAWLGVSTLAILRAADRVEPFAVRPWPVGHPPSGHEADPAPKPLPPGTPAAISAFPVYAAGPIQPREFAQRLARVLVDDRSYLHRDIVKGCVFRPGVAFRVWAEKRFVDVALCFQCDQVQVSPLAGRTGFSAVAYDDIDPARPELLRLARESLPDVPAVRALAEARPDRQ